MNYMLCVDVAQPLQIAAVVAALGKTVAAGTGANKLLGAWTTEFGEVDQVISLWEVDQPYGADGNLFAPQIECANLLDRRESKLLKLAFPFTPVADGSHFFDYRTYTVRPGTRDKFLALMGEALPTRKKHSQNLGVWVPVTGNTDQIIHMWAYRDMAHRNSARGGAWAEPVWQKYLASITPLLHRMQTGLLFPTSFSPLK